MKYILFMVACLSSLSLFAAEVNSESSWSEIAAAGYRVLTPQIWFGSTAVDVFDVCVDGVNLKTRGEVEQCQSYAHNKDVSCSGEYATQLERPLKTLVSVCKRYAAQHECVDWELKEESVSLTYQLPVLDSHQSRQGRDERKDQVAFMKNYSIPSCQ